MDDEWPSSPSALVVNSPRRTVSLLRARRATVSKSDPDEGASAFAQNHGPKPAEVYGFVGSISIVIAIVIYLVWAYTPEPWLHSLGITYYPSKYWALAIPAFAMVAVAMGMVFYLGLNFMATPPPTSSYTMFVSLDPIAGSEVTEEAIGVVHWCAPTDCAVLSSEGNCRLTVRYVGQYSLQGKLSAESDSGNVFGNVVTNFCSFYTMYWLFAFGYLFWKHDVA